MQQKKVKYHPRESQRIKQKLGKMGRWGEEDNRTKTWAGRETQG